MVSVVGPEEVRSVRPGVQAPVVGWSSVGQEVGPGVCQGVVVQKGARPGVGPGVADGVVPGVGPHVGASMGSSKTRTGSSSHFNKSELV